MEHQTMFTMTKDNQFNKETILFKFINIKFFSGKSYTTSTHGQMPSLKNVDTKCQELTIPKALSFKVKVGT